MTVKYKAIAEKRKAMAAKEKPVTVKDLFNRHPFDELAPKIVKICPDAAKHLAKYRAAYDLMLLTTPTPNNDTLSVYTEDYWVVKGKERKLVCKTDIEVEYERDAREWAYHLGSKLKVEKGISQVTAAAEILFDLTRHGFSPEDTMVSGRSVASPIRRSSSFLDDEASGYGTFDEEMARGNLDFSSLRKSRGVSFIPDEVDA